LHVGRTQGCLQLDLFSDFFEIFKYYFEFFKNKLHVARATFVVSGKGSSSLTITELQKQAIMYLQAILSNGLFAPLSRCQGVLVKQSGIICSQTNYLELSYIFCLL
jgi:hypothetical protein